MRSFSPTKPELGGKLTLLGKGFAKKRSRNTVVLRAPNGGSTFLKPSSATKKKLVVRLRSSIERLMAEKSGVTAATRFRVRVLAGKKFGPWTKKKRSPVIQPSGSGSGGGADADCDGDGSPNGADNDDDNDLLSDTVETQIKTDVCVIDTDRTVSRTASSTSRRSTSTTTRTSSRNTSLPYPGKRPYPNPLDPSDTGKDFDGDSLSSPRSTRSGSSPSPRASDRTLTPLYYSDGEQYSMNERGPDGRRARRCSPTATSRSINFQNWAGRTVTGR